MKKFLTIVLAVFLALSVCGCSSSPSDTLNAQGQSLANLVAQAAQSEAYLDLYSSSSSLRKILENAAQGDYSAPEAVYVLQFTDMPAQTDALPEPLSQNCRQRVLAAIPSQVNGTEGAETLAAATICTMSKTFVCSSVPENTIYLYQYADGFPIAVTFLPGEDDSVSASAVFLLIPDFPKDSEQEIADYFAQVLGVAAPQISRLDP